MRDNGGVRGRLGRKGLVEESLALRVGTVASATEGLPLGADTSVLAYSSADGSEPLFVKVRAVTASAVEVQYDRAGATRTYRIAVDDVAQPRGGVRIFFRCPLEIGSGLACGRRARTLYLPAGATYFGCRECHALTYESMQRPVAVRLRRLADELRSLRSMLKQGGAAGEVALLSAPQTVEGFLAAIEGRRDGNGDVS